MPEGTGPMDALSTILTRRSVGDLRPEAVPRADVERLITAATCAPNHHLTRPWRFVVLAGDSRRALGTAHAAAVARVDGPLDARRRAREEARLERAPVVIACICAGDPAADAVTARENRDAVAAGIQNILLAAHGSGLGAIWRTGTMVDEDEVASALGLAPHDEIVGFVYLGRPANRAPDRPRGAIDDLVEWRWPPES